MLTTGSKHFYCLPFYSDSTFVKKASMKKLHVQSTLEKAASWMYISTQSTHCCAHVICKTLLSNQFCNVQIHSIPQQLSRELLDARWRSHPEPEVAWCLTPRHPICEQESFDCSQHCCGTFSKKNIHIERPVLSIHNQFVIQNVENSQQTEEHVTDHCHVTKAPRIQRTGKTTFVWAFVKIVSGFSTDASSNATNLFRKR